MDIEEVAEKLTAEYAIKADASTIKTLRKARKKKSNGIAEGTVVKWKSSIYTYAAVYASGRWWITGSGRWYGGNEFEDSEFKEDILAKADAAWVVSGWAEL